MRYFTYETREGSHWKHYAKSKQYRRGFVRRVLTFPFDLVMLPLAVVSIILALLLMPILNFVSRRSANK